MSDERTPLEVVKELAPAYREWKNGEKDKEKFKKEFFAAIEEDIKQNGEPAEELIVVVGCASDTQAEEKAEKEYPGWICAAVRPHEDPDLKEQGAWECIIEEDPKYMPYTVEWDGFVWKKQVSEGAQMLDDERLAEEDPELWKRVAAFPMQSLLEDIAYEAGMHHTQVEEYVEGQCERHGVKRQLKDAAEISDKDLGSLQQYTYMGKPVVKLAAPSKIKE